jgi:sugar O-acyltransferase (sialic acid O-acetyltransferase NeuD family)
MDKIVIISGGGNSKVLITILKRLSKYDIVGYTDLKDNGSILGIKYIGDDSVLQNVLSEYVNCSAAIGMGMVDTSLKRKMLIEKIMKLGFKFPAIISNRAIIGEEISLGMGSLVFDGVVINSGTSIGKFCLLNTNSTIEHDCKIGNFTHISPAATLGGGVVVGENSLIGLGASIIQSKIIVNNCLIGAGAVVNKDCEVPGTYIGVPARRIK